MDWKKHFEEIKKGDMVILIKYHPTCNSGDCCSNTYKLNKPYKVDSINSDGPQYRIDRNCWFPKECLQKV